MNDAVMTGCNSRSRLLFFKHNDIDDLERVLKQVAEEDKRKKRKPQRRFIVVEGLYRNFGDLAPLAKIIELKEKYAWRVAVDETYSFGVLGNCGRGITEHHGLAFDRVELMVASMATSLASVGGFCVGKTEVVDHQRLSGAGIASQHHPSFLSCSAVAALKILEKEAGLLTLLGEKSELFGRRLMSARIFQQPVIPVRLLSMLRVA